MQFPGMGTSFVLPWDTHFEGGPGKLNKGLRQQISLRCLVAPSKVDSIISLVCPFLCLHSPPGTLLLKQPQGKQKEPASIGLSQDLKDYINYRHREIAVLWLLPMQLQYYRNGQFIYEGQENMSGIIPLLKAWVSVLCFLLDSAASLT